MFVTILRMLFCIRKGGQTQYSCLKEKEIRKYLHVASEKVHKRNKHFETSMREEARSVIKRDLLEDLDDVLCDVYCLEGLDPLK